MVENMTMVWAEIAQDGFYGQTILLQPFIFKPKVNCVFSDTDMSTPDAA